MYLDISLVDKDCKLIEEITIENNASYLVKGYKNPEFPYLLQEHVWPCHGAYRLVCDL